MMKVYFAISNTANQNLVKTARKAFENFDVEVTEWKHNLDVEKTIKDSNFLVVVLPIDLSFEDVFLGEAETSNWIGRGIYDALNAGLSNKIPIYILVNDDNVKDYHLCQLNHSDYDEIEDCLSSIIDEHDFKKHVEISFFSNIKTNNFGFSKTEGLINVLNKWWPQRQTAENPWDIEDSKSHLLDGLTDSPKRRLLLLSKLRNKS